MARLTEYNFELCKEICDQLADGSNIKRILNSNNKYPNWTTFRRWKFEHEELNTLYINSQQDKAMSIEDRLDDLEDMLISKEIDASTYNTLAQTLKWKMAKFYPKVFGDQSKLTLEGGLEIKNKQDYSNYSTEDLEKLAEITKKYEPKDK